MSQGTACRTPEHKPFWRVIQREQNSSAFNGYRVTRSAYSGLRCIATIGGCGTFWRTKAAYVDEIPDFVVGCPDQGTCHHECNERQCFRVELCGPLSNVYPGDRWPTGSMPVVLTPPSPAEQRKRKR